ncbi:Diatom spindle kinesin-1 [Penicillium rolfsii]|nr:Diatom spindle kinesin-1 [Penicillium rolfsii]
MEQFLLDNAARHQMLVERFKPPRQRTESKSEASTSNITVATRIRPMSDEEILSGQVVAVFPRGNSSEIVDVHDLRRVVRGFPPLISSSYQPGRVFGADVRTETIYEDVVHSLIPWAWDGNVGTLFAYGQTGSGKTFTVRGLEQLVAQSLFDGSLEGEWNIYLAVFELAGNSAFDLLNSRAPFSILEDHLGTTQLVGIKEFSIRSTAELLALSQKANDLRQSAPTIKNDGSSRSHAICRIRIERPSHEPADCGILYLIDLAGSEVARDVFSHSTERLKETREINMSLSVLKDCIRGVARVDNEKRDLSKKAYIPFRQSMLTKVLKHLFDPSESRKCRTTVVACLNPSFLDTGASKNTLRYAEMLCKS